MQRVSIVLVLVCLPGQFAVAEPDYDKKELVGELYRQAIGKGQLPAGFRARLTFVFQRTLGHKPDARKSDHQNIVDLVTQTFGGKAVAPAIWSVKNPGLEALRSFLQEYPTFSALPTLEAAFLLRDAQKKAKNAKQADSVVDLTIRFAANPKRGPIHPRLISGVHSYLIQEKSVLKLEQLGAILTKHRLVDRHGLLMIRSAKTLRIAALASLQKKGNPKAVFASAEEYSKLYPACPQQPTVALFLQQAYADELRQHAAPKARAAWLRATFGKVGLLIAAAPIPGVGGGKVRLENYATLIHLRAIVRATSLVGINRADQVRLIQIFQGAKIAARLGAIEKKIAILQQTVADELKKLRSIVANAGAQIAKAIAMDGMATRKALKDGFQQVDARLGAIETNTKNLIKIGEAQVVNLKQLNQAVDKTNVLIKKSNGKLGEIKKALDATNNKLDGISGTLDEIKGRLKRRKRSIFGVIERAANRAVEIAQAIRDEAIGLLSRLNPFPITVYEFDIDFSISFRMGSRTLAATVRGPAGIQISGDQIVNLLAGEIGSLENAIGINWVDAASAAIGFRLAREDNYTEFKRRVIQANRGAEVYFCSREFTAFFSVDQALSSAIAAFVGQPEREIEKMLRVLQSEMESVSAWAQSVVGRRKQALNPTRFVNTLISGFVNPNAKIEFAKGIGLKLNLYADAKHLHTNYRLEAAGVMRAPAAIIERFLKPFNRRFNARRLNVKLPNLGFSIVLKDNIARASPLAKLADKPNVKTIESAVARALEVSKTKVNPAGFGLKNAFAKPLQKFLPAKRPIDHSKLVGKFVGQIAEIRPKEWVSAGQRLAKCLRAGQLNLKELKAHVALENMLKKRCKIGNKGTATVDRMVFDLHTGRFEIDIRVHAKHEWGGLKGLPKEVKKFFSSLSF